MPSIYWIPLIPFLCGIVILFSDKARERYNHNLAISAVTAFALMILAQVVCWAQGNHLVFDQPLFNWEKEYQFNFSLHLDHVSAVFLLMTACLGSLVVRFSHYYMHREPGQCRFFANLLLFLSGMSVVELAADMSTLFMGWELVGLSSFLLIGFYRHREYPARNALKVYCIYRFCDLGLLVGTYLQHHSYSSLYFREFWSHQVPAREIFPISLLLLLSAAGKSGQFPFSFWVPRAMEGPTPSSAIFYGALSIHAGVFLLLRTLPLWIGCMPARICIGLVGLVSALLATGIAHVQSNIKGQIGYGSVAQVGLMFVELALGLDKLVLLHFVGNASLRCYQLLISPSVVAYLLKLQSTRSSKGRFSDWSIERILPNRLRSALFVLASQEAYMELVLNRFIFWLPQWSARYIFMENRTLLTVWVRSVVTLTALALLACRADLLTAEPYLAGLLVSFGLGLLGIYHLPSSVRNTRLDRYYGYGGLYPVQARLVFFSFLGMSGFPITPAFYGMDILLSAAFEQGPGIAALFALGLIFNGFVLARTFTRFFLGVELQRWKPFLGAGT
jgi:NADH-quinone oxidoreductase subunit L